MARVRAVGHAHVGRRIDQNLEDEWRAAAIARIERNDGRQVAPGTVASDRQPRGIDPEPSRVLAHPPRGRDGVLDGGWELVLRRESVVDRHDNAARRVGQRAAYLVVALQIADDPAPAVEVHERRLQGPFCGTHSAIKAKRDRTRRSHGLQSKNFGDLLGIRLQSASCGKVGFARLGRRQRLEGRTVRRNDQFAYPLRVRVKRLFARHFRWILGSTVCA